MLRVRPIHFTSRLDDYRRLLTALGMVAAVEEDGWIEFDAGSGRLALHAADPNPADPNPADTDDTTRDGTTVLGFEIRVADEFARRTRADGATADVVETDHGTAVRVVGAGLTFLADPVAEQPDRPAPGVDQNLSVCPLWYSPDVAAASKTLTAIGATPRITSDNGVWADFRARDGGLVAAHHRDSTGVVASFEYDGDLTVPEARLKVAGVGAAIVDESYGHSLRIDNPDGGSQIWVNRAQQDLYGYTRRP